MCSLHHLRYDLRSLNLAGTQTSGTNMQRLVGTADYTLNIFYVRVPDTIGSSMGMADIITEMRSLATNITFCHDKHLLAPNLQNTTRVFYQKPGMKSSGKCKFHNFS